MLQFCLGQIAYNFSRNCHDKEKTESKRRESSSKKETLKKGKKATNI